ncbi:MAG: acyl-CoA dehydratase activase [Marinifilaceae bacterium]|jgi:predicted CoA-substrate-specific enzyme activase|nr:acyl-CoA dehydratase activase [Marinifilaceae bacterium]
MNVLGADMGSRAVKLIIMNDDKVIYKKQLSTMEFYRDYCNYRDSLHFDLSRLTDIPVDIKISTGYGRNNTNLNDFTSINELKAHALGACYQSKEEDFILLDIGGQDVKVMRIENSVLTNMDLNDKCAASCGRYLENMANVLEVSLETLSKYSENPVELNSTCAVFSESELIGKIAEGISLDRLCAGVNYSLFRRLKGILSHYKAKKLFVGGGVASNKAVIKFLGTEYDEVIPLPDAQFNGAIGCCVYGKMLYKLNNLESN